MLWIVTLVARKETGKVFVDDYFDDACKVYETYPEAHKAALNLQNKHVGHTVLISNVKYATKLAMAVVEKWEDTHDQKERVKARIKESDDVSS